MFEQSQKPQIQRTKKGEILMVLVRQSGKGSIISKASFMSNPVSNNHKNSNSALPQKTISKTEMQGYAKQEMKNWLQEIDDEKNF